MIVSDHSRRAGILKMAVILSKMVSLLSMIGFPLNFDAIRRMDFDHFTVELT
jgi:Zn-dependent membrane protease YugP